MQEKPNSDEHVWLNNKLIEQGFIGFTGEEVYRAMKALGPTPSPIESGDFFRIADGTHLKM